MQPGKLFSFRSYTVDQGDCPDVQRIQLLRKVILIPLRCARQTAKRRSRKDNRKSRKELLGEVRVLF